MKLPTRIILIVVLSWMLAPTAWSKEDIQNSVVEICTVYDEYDYKEPWQKSGPKRACGSGCIIIGKRILTNAHVVAGQNFIRVRKAGDEEKYDAKVEFVSHESDLAILSVNDGDFFTGVLPIEVGGQVNIGDRVMVYGFPEGGDELSGTEAQIYRIENKIYTHRRTKLLTYQVHAPKLETA